MIYDLKIYNVIIDHNTRNIIIEVAKVDNSNVKTVEKLNNILKINDI